MSATDKPLTKAQARMLIGVSKCVDGAWYMSGLLTPRTTKDILKRRGLIVSNGKGRLFITDAGRAALTGLGNEYPEAIKATYAAIAKATGA